MRKETEMINNKSTNLVGKTLILDCGVSIKINHVKKATRDSIFHEDGSVSSIHTTNMVSSNGCGWYILNDNSKKI